MWFPSVLALWSSPSARKRCRQTPPLRFRPRLEALEDRWVPSTLYVTNNADNGAAGTLRWAVAQAKAGDTIDILSKQPITLTHGELYLAKNLTIEAPAGSQATISGGGNSRVFEVAAGSVGLDNLVITGGNSSLSSGLAYGGGIRNSATLTVSHCTLSGNSAYIGGGIFNTGTLTLDNSALSGNSAWDAAGIYNAGTLTVNDSTLSGNSSNGMYGGGIWNVGSLMVSNSTLSNNSTGYWGGGVLNYGYATLIGCTLSGNSAGLGGGIANYGGHLTLTSCSLSGNYASDGGAVYTAAFTTVHGTHRPAFMTISNCTLSDNRATSGGAIYIGPLYGGTAHVGDSTFFGNTPDNIFGPYIDDGGNKGL